MKISTWMLNALSSQHIKSEFDCGEAALDDYLKRFAGQHAKSKISKTFVATHLVHSNKVVGYYTLTAGSIGFDSLPAEFKKKLLQYPIPIAKLGRLAVDKLVQGQGLGEYLLMNALSRCARLTEEIGIVGIVVDAEHQKAKSFYQQYGFSELTNLPLTLFMSIQTVIATM